ncbi:MAG: hypothetical protein ACKPGK_01775, partial [Verrucomicrobiota bacterium]
MVFLMGCHRNVPTTTAGKRPDAPRSFPVSASFPVGIYGVPGVEDLRAVHAAGFSRVMGGLDPVFMDEAARLGLEVVATPGSSAGPGFDP